MDDILCPSLHDACDRGLYEVVKLCIAAGCDFDEPGLASPLYLASRNGHHRVVTLLIAAGCDVDKPAYQDGHDYPLHVASRNGHDRVVTLLIAAGCDVDKADARGLSPLHIASCTGHDRVVKLLIAAGCDTTTPGTTICTPLYTASRNGHARVVTLLIAAGCRCSSDRPLLHQAASQGNLTVVDTLISIYPRPGTWYMFLMGCGAPSTLAAYRTARADRPRTRSIESRHHLPRIYIEGVIRLIWLFLRKPRYVADLNQLDFVGDTALQLAVDWKHHAVAALLRENGAT